MTISGLVIQLDDDMERAELARAALRQEPRLTLGEARGSRVPAVLDVAELPLACGVHEWLRSVPGVLDVRVVFVDVEGDSSQTGGDLAVDDSTSPPQAQPPFDETSRGRPTVSERSGQTER